MIAWPTPIGYVRRRCFRCGETLEIVPCGLHRVRLRCVAGDTVEGLDSEARWVWLAHLRYWWSWYFGRARWRREGS